MLGDLVLTPVMLGAMILAPQQPGAPSQTGPAPGAASKTLNADAVKITDKILASYYHPDNLPGLECDVTPGWTDFFNSTRMTVTQDQAHQMEALKIHVRALRDATPEISFNWTQGKLANADQVEALLRRTITQFYQIYWNMFASPAVKYAAVISKIEPLPDGTTKVYESDSNAYVVMTVAKDGTPTHYTMQGPGVNGIVDAQYARSPHPRNGDRRRLTEVNVSEQSGTSSMNVQVTVDYQPLKDYFVPGHISFSQVGAYTLPLDFSGCTIPAPAATSK
jgi:hypothetical protein